jgi:exopolysaccharide biosynthesis protein
VKTSRTLIGLTADQRTLLLLTAEKMTVAEAASLLASGFGASDALNLDGGGSTSLVVRDPETGKPEVLAGTGRAVCSSLAVFAPPRAATQ